MDTYHDGCGIGLKMGLPDAYVRSTAGGLVSGFSGKVSSMSHRLDNTNVLSSDIV
jgi:hypothetical protein